MTGGFPNPATFPTDEVDEIAARLVRDDAAVALQYTPCEGIASVREYLIERQEQLQGRRPERGELIVTSGGMECIALMCQALIDPGDAIVVEAPSYLGALMAFAGAEAEVVALAMDDDGLRIDVLAERLAAGLRPKFLYTIPEYQNPTGRTLTLARRRALVELCRRHRVLIFEDVAYRELPFARHAAAVAVVARAGHRPAGGDLLQELFPGVRLGWATGPADVIAELAAAKQTTDQCAGGLGQRLLEEYGRAGGFERHLPAARALYASRWAALSAALAHHMPDAVEWTEPTGGFLTWLTLPEGLDTARDAPRRHRGGSGLRSGAAVPRRRRRAQHAAPVVRPPDRDRARDRRRAPRRRGPLSARRCRGRLSVRPAGATTGRWDGRRCGRGARRRRPSAAASRRASPPTAPGARSTVMSSSP